MVKRFADENNCKIARIAKIPEIEKNDAKRPCFSKRSVVPESVPRMERWILRRNHAFCGIKAGRGKAGSWPMSNFRIASETIFAYNSLSLKT